jgi:hypothetical protein
MRPSPAHWGRNSSGSEDEERATWSSVSQAESERRQLHERSWSFSGSEAEVSRRYGRRVALELPPPRATKFTPRKKTASRKTQQMGRRHSCAWGLRELIALLAVLGPIGTFVSLFVLPPAAWPGVGVAAEHGGRVLHLSHAGSDRKARFVLSPSAAWEDLLNGVQERLQLGPIDRIETQSGETIVRPEDVVNGDHLLIFSRGELPSTWPPHDGEAAPPPPPASLFSGLLLHRGGADAETSEADAYNDAESRWRDAGGGGVYSGASAMSDHLPHLPNSTLSSHEPLGGDALGRSVHAASGSAGGVEQGDLPHHAHGAASELRLCLGRHPQYARAQDGRHTIHLWTLVCILRQVPDRDDHPMGGPSASVDLVLHLERGRLRARRRLPYLPRGTEASGALRSPGQRPHARPGSGRDGAGMSLPLAAGPHLCLCADLSTPSTAVL